MRYLPAAKLGSTPAWPCASILRRTWPLSWNKWSSRCRGPKAAFWCIPSPRTRWGTYWAGAGNSLNHCGLETHSHISGVCECALLWYTWPSWRQVTWKQMPLVGLKDAFHSQVWVAGLWAWSVSILFTKGYSWTEVCVKGLSFMKSTTCPTSYVKFLKDASVTSFLNHFWTCYALGRRLISICNKLKRNPLFYTHFFFLLKLGNRCMR